MSKLINGINAKVKIRWSTEEDELTEVEEHMVYTEEFHFTTALLEVMENVDSHIQEKQDDDKYFSAGIRSVELVDPIEV